MSKPKRSVESYLQSAKSLAPFAPGLTKYRRRKTLKPSEKGAITRKENALAFHTDKLIPVSKKLARQLKDQLFIPSKRIFDEETEQYRYEEGRSRQGIRAIELRNTAPNAKIHKIGPDMLVTSNGRTFLYWKLDREDVKTKKGMTKAAAAVFDNQLPIERVSELAKVAFDELKPLAVYLWAPSGRVGNGFESLKQFSIWLAENWSADRYSQQEKWVNGIVILLKDDNWRKSTSVLKPIDPNKDPRKPKPPKKRKRR
jgi:hypothetical protein